MSRYVRPSVNTLHAYVPGEQPAENAGIVKLNTNENPYPPSPRVGETLRAFAFEDLSRYPNPVSATLRARIAAIHGVDARQVFVGNGSDEVLALCTRAFVRDGHAVGCFDVTYSLYPVLAAIRDVPTRITALADDFAWAEPDTEGCDIFFLANPNAPTGRAVAPDVISAFAGGFEGVVVVDEAYADFAESHCMPLATSRENVVVTRTLSKSFSLAGLRLGYAVGPAALIAALDKIKDSYNVNALTQRLACAALDDLAYMQGRVAQIKATRERTRNALLAMGHRVAASQANFLWMEPAGIGAEELFQSLKKRGILIRYFPGALTGHFVRITVSTDADMDALLTAVSAIVAGKEQT